MKKAFTLIEVNLAMMVMATGILAIVSLYAFGYRESRQSREDVAATALADTVMSQLMAAITSKDLKWSEFAKIKNYPSDEGWADYFESDGIVKKDPTETGKKVFTSLMNNLQAAGLPSTFEKNFPQSAVNYSGMKFGLVITHEKNSPMIGVAFRATKQPGQLLAMPLYYCEGRFQGDPTK